MAKPSVTPDQIRERLREMRDSTEADRRELLRKSVDEARQEARALVRVRERLVQAVGLDDPRIRILDRRVTGNERMADSIENNLSSGPRADWTVTGLVTDANGKPVPGALITLTSEDQDLVRRFGETKTGNDGRFEVRHSAESFQDIFERAPKARLVVTSPDGKLTHTTHEIKPASDTIHAFEVRLRPEKPKRGQKQGSAKGNKKGPE